MASRQIRRHGHPCQGLDAYRYRRPRHSPHRRIRRQLLLLRCQALFSVYCGKVPGSFSTPVVSSSGLVNILFIVAFLGGTGVKKESGTFPQYTEKRAWHLWA